MSGTGIANMDEDRSADFIADGQKPQFRLLSFEEAKTAGEAMHDRWKAMTKSPDEFGKSIGHTPLRRDDAAWADLFRAGYEAIR